MKHPIVKYANRFWVFERVEDGKAILWSNGEMLKVPLDEILFYNA
jgi:hypothetical protein